MIPIRCFTCNKVIAHKYLEYCAAVHDNHEEAGAVLDRIGFKRSCCRTMFLTHVDQITEELKYFLEEEEFQR